MHRSALELGRAFETTGFALICGHGIPNETVQELHRATVAFYDGPQHLKDEIRAEPVFGAQGFHAQGHENVSQLLGDFSRPPDAVERITVRNLHHFMTGSNAVLEAGDSSFGGPGTAAPKLPSLPGFRATTEAYFDAVHGLFQMLNRMSEHALDLPDGFFDPFYGQSMGSSMQLGHYLHSGLADGELAFGEHTDSISLNILVTDAPGLEVFLADGWHAVPIIEGAFVVNVGRLLSRWTNDRWLAAVHRVKKPPQRKLTITSAFWLRGDATIECLPSCQGPGLPPKYAPITAAEFLHKRHLLHIPPEQRAPEEREIPREFWEAALPSRL